MSKQFLFLDESGNTTLKDASSNHLVIGTVLVVDHENLISLTDAMNEFRTKLGWKELQEIKFMLTKKSIIIDLLKFIQQFEFEVYGLVIDKRKITALQQLEMDKSLYNYVIKELLIRLKLTDPVIFIDGVAHKKQAERIRTYLRQNLRQHGVVKSKIRFVDSRKEVLIQLADVVAGSIARSYSERKANNKEYIKLLEPKIVEIYEITP